MRMTRQSEVPYDEEKRKRQFRVKYDGSDDDADGDGGDDADNGDSGDDDDGDGEKKAICRGRKMRHK